MQMSENNTEEEVCYANNGRGLIEDGNTHISLTIPRSLLQIKLVHHIVDNLTQNVTRLLCDKKILS
jgi:hypothetical protein